MFTPEEKKLLEQYVTSAEANVFAVRGLSGVVGAAYARYSRAKGGFRETLLKEFIKEGVIDPLRANELIERVLVAYGDDSVGELEGAHLSFENISMLATKEIEDRRIGGSPIEQSTRYVVYDQKIDGPAAGEASWRYLRGEELINAPFGKQYLATMDFVFETYTGLVEPMKEYFTQLKPMEAAEYDINGDGQKEKYSDLTDEKDRKAFRTTYTFDLRSKACDTLRCLLPLATLTNVGLFGNGRFFQHAISYLLTSDLPEAGRIAREAFAAASQVIPQYVRRAKRSEYQANNRENMRTLSAISFTAPQPEIPSELPSVKLLPETDRDLATLAAMLFPYSNLSLVSLRNKVAAASQAEKEKIIAAYVGERKTRRDRPGRALEDGYPYTLELVTNWGVYKDLMRHRMNSQQRQLFTTKIGFDLSPEITAAGFESKVRECLARVDALCQQMAGESPVLAQYAVLHGHFVRWTLGMNDRGAMHLIELRTTPQGHPNYRRVAQMIHREIAARSPWRGAAMKFADHDNYYWSRADSEARQRVEEKKLDERFSKPS
ncbi:MAG: FAD-dependent thymidylate synthase [Candidatus Liptonbacteria bacterium]|nr:FAD-dependent thymidylate synthase [Candidatus Liptonbacteria bacterium]